MNEMKSKSLIRRFLNLPLRMKFTLSFLVVICFGGVITLTLGTRLEHRTIISLAQAKVEHDLDAAWMVYQEKGAVHQIKRKFISFEKLIDPGELGKIKIWTNEVEEIFSNRSDQERPRPINIDPGYVGLSKLVLATTKNYSHRVYLGSGIYGEVTLQYKDGEYKPQPWTYPDYKSEEYLAFFARVREKYCRQLE